MAETEPTQQEVDFGPQADVFVAHFAKAYPLDAVKDALSGALVNAFAGLIDGTVKAIVPIATLAGKGIVKAEEPLLPILAGFIAPIVAGMFGTEVDASAFADRATADVRQAASRAIVDKFLEAIAGDADGPQEPSTEGARRVAAAGVHAAIEGWFMSAIPELLSDFLPLEIGHFSSFKELPEEVISALGIGRLVRRALGPFINATAVQPLTWYTNKKYRPTKLSAATIARQLARGGMDADRAYELLARDGYRDEDISAILNDLVRYQAATELDLLVRVGRLDRSEAVQELRDAGWDEDRAASQFDLERFKRIEAFDAEMATAAIAAYADRRIDGSMLDTFTDGTTFDDQHRSQLRELAAAKRALNIKFLSSAQAEACVKADVLPLAEYRAALEREGYVPDAVDALEMLLRAALDKTAKAADLKAAQQAAKDAAAEAKARTAAAHAQAVDQAAAVKAFGPIGVLKDAVIRGLAPIQRLQDALALQFPADTVAITLDDVETKRAAYLAAQQKAADATKRAANKGLSVAELQAALNDHILTIDQVADSLTAAGTPDADVAILRQVMADKAAQVQAANALHAAAAKKSASTRIPLTKADALVKAGHWTLAQYNDYLSTLGYGAGDIANLDALLKDALAKANAAASIQQQTTTADGARGLSLTQFRAAVVLGTKSIADYQQFLVGLNFSADAVATLVADAEDALNTANAARARRTSAAGPLDGRSVPLADLTRAAQLGLLAPADYQAALVAAGYSAEDAALETDLLAAELRAAGGAVRVGTSTGAAAAQAKHVDIDGQLTAKGLSLAKTEKAVTDGLMTLDAYQSWLEANGYSRADAELLRALLATAVAAKGGAASTTDAGAGTGP